MFERFTESARQVVILAQEEARTLMHNHIGTEHILLGLSRAKQGSTATVLESQGVTVERVRGRVLEIVGSGDEIAPGQIPFTPAAKRTLEMSPREALMLGHNFIASEHLLLALTAKGDRGVSRTLLGPARIKENELASRILRDLGADSEQIRGEVIRRLADVKGSVLEATRSVGRAVSPVGSAAGRRLSIPEWTGPPENLVPGIVALELLLVATDRHAVWLGQAEVYPTGVVLRVDLIGREPARPGVESEPGTWSFEVQFSDGRKTRTSGLGVFAKPDTAASIPVPGVRAGESATTGSPPVSRQARPWDGLVLRSLASGGNRSKWRQTYWLWPLPPPGDLILACEWPKVGTERTTATINADLLRDAAGRGKPLWPTSDPPNQNQ